MVAVPVEMPETNPPEETVAIMVLLDDHVPPVGELDNVLLLPTQIVAVPVIAVSSLITVFPVFHLSPASAAPPFTAFITPLKVTLPVPEEGAVQGMFIT